MTAVAAKDDPDTGNATGLRPLDIERLRDEFNRAEPFRWLHIDPFLEPAFAEEIAGSYPSFDRGREYGFEFSKVNERRKVQITDRAVFPPPVRRLHDALCAPEFLDALTRITGIPNLLADPDLIGGGMHLTGPGGRLDVHVDFNYVPERAWHRRLNILVYLNPRWEADWGGGIELWDRNVQRRHYAFAPKLNRCILFETSNISYHGVQPVTCPKEVHRKSFAAYYYTKEPPAGWDGREYSTIFRARPHELLRGKLLMPLEDAQRRAVETLRELKRTAKKVLRRE